jgi:hypothetical protein
LSSSKSTFINGLAAVGLVTTATPGLVKIGASVSGFTKPSFVCRNGFATSTVLCSGKIFAKIQRPYKIIRLKIIKRNPAIPKRGLNKADRIRAKIRTLENALRLLLSQRSSTVKRVPIKFAGA